MSQINIDPHILKKLLEIDKRLCEDEKRLTIIFTSIQRRRGEMKGLLEFIQNESSDRRHD